MLKLFRHFMKSLKLVLGPNKNKALYGNRVWRRVLFDKILQQGLLANHDLNVLEIDQLANILKPFANKDINVQKIARLINVLQTKGAADLGAFKDLLLLEDLTFREYFLLNEIFLYLGKFSRCFVLRELYVDTLINTRLDTSKAQNVDILFKALLDKRKIKEGHDLIIGNKRSDSVLLNELRFRYLDLYKLANVQSQIQVTHQDEGFTNFVKGKRVAIVGPCKSFENNGHVIDEYDIVVRFNFRGKGQSFDPATQGTKTTISYYNGLYSKFFDENNALIDVNLKYAVFKEEQDLSRLASNMKAICRIMPAYNNVLSFTNFNAIPNAVIDLLLAQAAEIKIFNSDLMLDKDYNSYQSYRPATMEKTNLRYGFFGHNPIDQFRILHGLWSRGRISGDHRFTEVLSYGELEYLKQFEEIYLPSYQ